MVIIIKDRKSIKQDKPAPQVYLLSEWPRQVEENRLLGTSSWVATHGILL